MKALLFVTVLFWGFAALAYKAANQPTDDFGAGVYFVILVVLSVLFTVVYITAAVVSGRLV